MTQGMSQTKHPILIVEDSPDDYYAAVRGLKSAGLANNFIHCETGESALDYLFRRKHYQDDKDWVLPHLVLLDLNLPGINGGEVLEAMDDDKDLSLIPVIVLTTSDDPNDIQDSYAKGANSYICKPVDIDGFVGALKRLKDYWFEVVVLPGTRAP